MAGLRVAAAQSPQARRLVELLQRQSPEFDRIWQAHDVATRFADHKPLVHPELGEIELDCQTLYSEDQFQALLVLTAAPTHRGGGEAAPAGGDWAAAVCLPGQLPFQQREHAPSEVAARKGLRAERGRQFTGGGARFALPAPAAGNWKYGRQEAARRPEGIPHHA